MSMMWLEAQKIIKEWHERHPKEELCAQSEDGAPRLSFVGKRAAKTIQKYTTKQVMDAMAEIELSKGWPKFGLVLDFLAGQRTYSGDGARMWQNGDVVEVEGVVGIISRDDSIDYAQLSIPKRAPGRNVKTVIYWTDGTPRAGDARKLPDADAWEWAREWMDEPPCPGGLDVWRKA